MLLVLAVMVAIGAMVWPSLSRPFEVEHLRKAADQVRAEWGKTRVEAMSSGLVQVFRYQPQGATYAVQPWVGPDANLQMSSTLAAQSATGYGATSSSSFGPGSSGVGGNAGNSLSAGPYGAGGAVSTDKKLPEGILFLQSQTGADSRASNVAVALPTDILFYPDGSTSDAQLMLENENGEYLIISLYGMTGISTVGEVLRRQGLGPEQKE